MKITKEEIADVLELLDDVNEFKPLVGKITKVLIEYGGEFKELFDAIQDRIVDSRIRIIRKYQDSGFTKEEAILFTLDSNVALRTYLENIKVLKT